MPVNDRHRLRLLHTADLHLGAPFSWLGELAATRQQDLLRTLRRTCELAVREQVDLVLVAGDLFDHPRPEPSLVLAVQQALDSLLQVGITPVLLPGTHDGVWGGMTPYRAEEFPGSVLLDRDFSSGPRHLDVNGKPVWIYGAAFRGEKPAEIYPAMRRREGEGYHLGVLHGSLRKGEHWDYRDKDIPFTLEELTSWGLDYVALGHYHSFQLLESQEGVLACYPGSPEGKRFSENGDRYVALVEVAADRVRVEPLRIQSRTLQTLAIDLTLESSLDALHRQLAGLADNDLLLRIELTGQVDAPLDTAALQRHFSEAFFHLEIHDRTHFLEGGFLRQIAKEQTIAGACVGRFRALLEERPEDRDLIELALKEVVLRFRLEGGEGS